MAKSNGKEAADDGRMFPKSRMYCEGRRKPILRGFVHLIGTTVLVPMWISEVSPHLDHFSEGLALSLLTLGTIACWGASALFHTIPWSLQEEIRWQKFDHAAIFLKIACAYTPFAYLALGKPHGQWLDSLLWGTILLTWAGAVWGVWHVHNVREDRIKYHGLLIVASFPSYFVISSYLTVAERMCAIVALLCYPLGAHIFVNKLFDWVPHLFGYHEVFHCFTLLSGWLGFVLLMSVVSDLDRRCSFAQDVYRIPGASIFANVLVNTISSPTDICGNFSGNWSL